MSEMFNEARKTLQKFVPMYDDKKEMMNVFPYNWLLLEIMNGKFPRVKTRVKHSVHL